jgi:hypothetical protein
MPETCCIQTKQQGDEWLTVATALPRTAALGAARRLASETAWFYIGSETGGREFVEPVHDYVRVTEGLDGREIWRVTPSTPRRES